MKREELGAVLEALLFVAEGPVDTEGLAAVLPEEARPLVEEALTSLAQSCEAEARGIQLVRLAGGWRLQTRPDLYTWVSEFLKVRRTERLSRQGLETLAVVTYRQPVTAPEVGEIRGVDPSAAIRTLLEKGLIRITGRKKVVGKPFLYGTTRLFLEEFGLDSLDDLPDLKEFEELLEERYQEPLDVLPAAEDAAADATEEDGAEDTEGGTDGSPDDGGKDTGNAGRAEQDHAQVEEGRDGPEEA